MCCCLLLSSNLPKVSYLCMSESLKNSFLPNACFVKDLVKAVVNPFSFSFFFHYMWHRFESVSDSTPAFLRVKRSLSQPISSLGGLKTHLQVEIRHWRAAGSGSLQNLTACFFWSCKPAIYIWDTLVYMSKMHRKSEHEIWFDSREITLLGRIFQLQKVEKQADIQSVYTDIQTRYNINMCKKCDWQGNVEGRLF